ncbi:cobalamin-dependent protein, partial [Candidatus Woesearchaeota archaeon]|nr:cobalamin-dependent protein [Candidatus Woesearchaeota archaeon]
MKVLLINVRIDKIVHVPLGVLQVGATLEQEGHQVRVFDPLFDDWSLEVVKGFRPDIIGVSYMTSNFAAAKKIISDIKQYNPKIKILAGGIHPSFNVQESLDIGVDIVVRGRSETVLPDLLKTLEKKDASMRHVNGIIFKDRSGKIIRTAEADPVRDINRIPLPAYHLINMDEYLIPPGYIRSLFLNRVAVIYTSKGCSYSCSFCDIPLLENHTVHYYSLKKVTEHIDLFVREHKVDGIYFGDEVFTLDRKRTLKVLDILKRYGLPWGCQTRVDLVDSPLLKRMSESGCRQIDYGVESGSDRILKRIGKRITRKQIIEAFRNTRKHGIRTFATIMLGHPTETVRDIEDTMGLLKIIRPTFTLTSFNTPFPRTSNYDWAIRTNRLNPDFYESEDYHFYAEDKPLVNISDVPDSRLIYYKRKIDRMTFYRNYMNMINLHNAGYL